jgi:hypothetical protein
MFSDIGKKVGNNLAESTSALNSISDIVEKVTEPNIKYDKVLESISRILKNIPPPRDKKVIEEAIEKIKLLLL